MANMGVPTSSPSMPSGALKQVRELRTPTREETLRRDGCVYRFWDDNEELLQRAWREWDETSTADLPKLDDSILNGALRAAVAAAWESPTAETEAAVKALWTEVAPGVFATQFLDLERVSTLHAWLRATEEAGVPTRPPYGIVLNRRGAMLDPRSVGHLAAPSVQSFYSMLVDDYVRPISRALFPGSLTTEAHDEESFAFSIEYQGDGDKSIRPHTDASAITFNINIDAAKTWTGSSLVFYAGSRQYSVEWQPGMAVVHLGQTMHAALPIETGTRANWVIWTMGSGASRSYGVDMEESDEEVPEGRMTVQQRWTKPKGERKWTGATGGRPSERRLTLR